MFRCKESLSLAPAFLKFSSCLVGRRKGNVLGWGGSECPTWFPVSADTTPATRLGVQDQASLFHLVEF